MKNFERKKFLSGMMAVLMTASSAPAVPALAAGGIGVSEDAVVGIDDDSASINYGAEECMLLTADETGAKSIAYLKFDISGIDPAAVGDITLRLKVNEGTDGDAVELSETDSDWNEDSITGENRPSQGAGVASGIYENGEIVITGLKDAVVNAINNGKTEVSFALMLGSGTTLNLASKESGDGAELTTEESADVDADATESAAIPFEEVVNTDIILMSQDEIDAVVAKIDELAAKVDQMNGENYVEYRAELDEVQAMYDALSYADKMSVGNTELQKLTNAQTKYDQLETKDINAFKTAVAVVNTDGLDEDNYLDSGVLDYYTKAMEYYDEISKRAAEIADSDYPETQQRYAEMMEQINSIKAVLDEATDKIEGLVKATTQKFIDAVNDSSVTEEMFDMEFLPNGEVAELDEGYTVKFTLNNSTEELEYISRFVTEESYNNFMTIDTYINNVYNMYESIKNSDVFENFKNDEEFSTAWVQYLENLYRYRVDLLKVFYGDVQYLNDSIQNLDNWNEGDMTSLYVYIGTLRPDTDSVIDDLNDMGAYDEDLLADYEEFHADFFTEMLATVAREISAYVYNVLPLTGETIADDALPYVVESTDENGVKKYKVNYTENDLKDKQLKSDLPLTEDNIDELAHAMYGQTKDGVEYHGTSNFNLAVYGYLVNFDANCYVKLFGVDEDGNLLTENPIVTKAHEILKRLADEQLAKYDDLIARIKAYALDYKSGYRDLFGETDLTDDRKMMPADFIADVKADAAALEEMTALARKYYKDIEKTEAPVDTELESYNAAVEAFETQMDAIDVLQDNSLNARSKYEDFTAKFFDADDIDTVKSSYNDFEKYEDVEAYVADILSAYNSANGTSLTMTDVKNEIKAAYDAIYGTDGYTDAIAVYKGYGYAYEIPAENNGSPYMSQAEMDNVVTILNFLERDIDLSPFPEDVDALYETVIGFEDKIEEIYEDNTYSDIEAAKTEYARLKAILDGYNDAQLFNVTRDTLSKLTTINEKLASWDKAISVMDAIDDIDDAEDVEDLVSRTETATEAYDAVDEGTDAKKYIAEAAVKKLEFYRQFAELCDRITDIPVIVSQYQIEDYDTELTEIRSTYDELNADEYAENSAVVAAIGKILSDREEEMACAKRAKEVDDMIKALDDYDLTDADQALEYIKAFIEVDEVVGELLDPEEEDERPANMTFGMLLQYSKFTHHRENYDNIIISSFVNAVDSIGEITYTTEDLDGAAAKIEEAEELYDLMNLRQKSDIRSEQAQTKLQMLKADLERVLKAKENAQAYIDKLDELKTKLDEVYAMESKRDREAEYADIMAGIEDMAELTETMEAAEDGTETKEAYEYLAANGYINDFYTEKAEFEDRFAYYEVQTTIDLLWAAAQASVPKAGDDVVTLLDAETLLMTEKLYAALANREYYFDTGKNQQEMVENYAKLVWIREQVNEQGEAYANQLMAYMDEYLADADPENLSIKYKNSIADAAYMYEALSATNRSAYLDPDYEDRIVALIAAQAELDGLYATRGGKAGDIDEDGKVTIRDIVMMVDFIQGAETPDNGQWLRADVVYSEDVDEDVLDINDVIAAIDLIDF